MMKVEAAIKECLGFDLGEYPAVEERLIALFHEREGQAVQEIAELHGHRLALHAVLRQVRRALWWNPPLRKAIDRTLEFTS